MPRNAPAARGGGIAGNPGAIPGGIICGGRPCVPMRARIDGPGLLIAPLVIGTRPPTAKRFSGSPRRENTAAASGVIGADVAASRLWCGTEQTARRQCTARRLCRCAGSSTHAAEQIRQHAAGPIGHAGDAQDRAEPPRMPPASDGEEFEDWFAVEVLWGLSRPWESEDRAGRRS